MFTRIWIYFIETFKLPSRLALTVLNVFIIQLYTINQFDPYLFLIGSVVLFFSLLYYRICDEFKDEETDKIFFPERPLPSGRVKKEDLKGLRLLAGFFLLSFPLLSLPSVLWGYFVFIDCLLMQFYFFVPKKMEKNRLLAFATHAPYAIVVNFYLVALHCLPNNIPILSSHNIALIIALSIPGFHWEVIRKTFVRERPGYQTYSSLLGYQGAIFLSLVFFIPITIALKIILLEVYFIPLVILFIVYGVHIWGLGLHEREGSISLQAKSEFISTVIVLVLVWQGIKGI